VRLTKHHISAVKLIRRYSIFEQWAIISAAPNLILNVSQEA
jgi:hypothetical protein